MLDYPAQTLEFHAAARRPPGAARDWSTEASRLRDPNAQIPIEPQGAAGAGADRLRRGGARRGAAARERRGRPAALAVADALTESARTGQPVQPRAAVTEVAVVGLGKIGLPLAALYAGKGAAGHRLRHQPGRRRGRERAANRPWEASRASPRQCARPYDAGAAARHDRHGGGGGRERRGGGHRARRARRRPATPTTRTSTWRRRAVGRGLQARDAGGPGEHGAGGRDAQPLRQAPGRRVRARRRGVQAGVQPGARVLRQRSSATSPPTRSWSAASTRRAARRRRRSTARCSTRR